MRRIKKHAKSASKRSLSFVLAVIMFIGLFSGTLGVILSLASNPTHTGALNTYIPVECINLLPVEIGTTKYVDDDGRSIVYEDEDGKPIKRVYEDNEKYHYEYLDGTKVEEKYVKLVSSRTSYGSSDFVDTFNVTVNGDNSVRMAMKKQLPGKSSDTTYVFSYTQVNQKVNLQENPFLYLNWSANCRVNGAINFSFKRGEKTYYIDNKGTNDYKDDTVQELTTSDKLITPKSSSTYKNSNFTFYQIEEGIYYRSDERDKNDFGIMNDADYSIDFYTYLYKYFELKGWVKNYWPQWSKGDYLTVNYVQHTLVSEKVNTPLFEHYCADWNTCALGRIAMTPGQSLTPRADGIVAKGRWASGVTFTGNLTNHIGDSHPNDIEYKNSDAASARLDDGTYVFRNKSKDRDAIFRWPVNRFMNANEIKAIYLNMEMANVDDDSDIQMAFAIQGKNNTTDSSVYYTAAGYWATLDDLIKNHSDKGSVSSHDRYKDVTMNLYDDAKETRNGFTYPTDQMIRIREIILYVPAMAKVSFFDFCVKIENEYAPSTTTDTVYPWYSTQDVDNLPPTGTPATSSALDSATGANSAAYNWKATEIPVVENKVDLLSMTDQHVKYDTNGQFDGFETNDATGYWRTVEGESHFTSNTTDIVYRAFRRREKNAPVSANARESDNRLIEIPVSTTPYLYYSYSMTGNGDEAVGFYFNVANPPETVKYKHYYLGQSGLALQQCDAIMSSTNKTVAEAHRALCSSAPARTGIIDLRSIGYKDGDIAKIENMRFYLTGTATEVTFNYLFFGSESLDNSVTSTIAKNSGDAFPWAITHDQFKKATLGSNSKFTFANRLDLIADMFDRKAFGLGGDDAAAEDALCTKMDRNEDGSMTITASNKDRLVYAGTSFDHMLQFTIDKADLASIRYINYSVDADPGMRWSILIREHGDNTDPAVAIRTWSDAYMTGDFYGNDDAEVNAKDSKATVGKSYFREMTKSVFDNNWTNGNGSLSNYEDEAFAMFTVPGDETGCFDLSQIQHHMSWNAVVSIYFIAYKDPSLMTEGGTTRATGSVTFNYVYLTSEPLEPSSWGAMPKKDNQTYSWGYDGPDITFDGNYVVAFNDRKNQDDWATDFRQNSSSSKLAIDQNYKDSYSVYFSYTFTKRNADGTDSWVQAYPENVMIGFFKNGWTYKLYTRRSYLGKVNNLVDDIDALKGQHKHLTPFSGSVKINDLGFDELEFIRVYYDRKNYVIHPEYTVVACKWTVKPPSDGKTTLIKLEKKVADFSGYKYAIDMSVVKVVSNEGGTEFTADTTYSKDLKVDLNRTPYLFYSIKYSKGAKGTFALGTDISIDGLNGFFRNGVYSDIGSKNLLSPGITPSDDNYLMQSETGCIDVKSWLQRQDALPSNGIIKIKSINAYVSGGTALYNYMYFGAEADKTIDLIPKQAEADLASGVSTHSWGYDNSQYCGEMRVTTEEDIQAWIDAGLTEEEIAEKSKWDTYIADSRYNGGKPSNTDPTIKALLPGDRNDDGYNDLRYSDKKWGFYSICYGEVNKLASETTYKYVTTGNNQTSGLTINLNETPYLHFSISQSKDSYTTFLLQTNDETGRGSIRGLSAEKVKPHLSCYNTQSPAGQLMHISPQTSYITFYKDTTMTYDNGTYNNGDLAGVIDLRRWYTETNGYSDMISLERVRFYTTNQVGKYTDATVNHFYLSSSSGSAYTVMFDKNDGTDTRQTIQVLKNANDQFVSDKVPTDLGFKVRDGYTFMGWYLDPEWEEYFDISKTPIHENIILYAGWLNNKDVVTGELNLVDRASKDQTDAANKVTTSDDNLENPDNKQGQWETDEEALHIRNTGTKDYTITIPVNKAYSLYDSHSIYLGIDVSNTVEANVDLTNESRTSDGARIVLDVKSRGTHSYDLIGEDFGSYFLTENNMLTAAPYNKQLPMYMHLANKSLLPVTELPKTEGDEGINVKGNVYVKSISITVPAGAAIHIRYATAAKAIEATTHTVVAPEITGTVIDLLDSKGDEGYVEQINNVAYEELEEKTEIYNRTSTPTTLKQAHISGTRFGYATLGSLYGLGDALGEVVIDKNNQQYLYYSITQSEQSSTTFNMWVSIFYTTSASSNNPSKHPDKWSTFLDARDNTLSSQADMINGSIPFEAYVKGSASGRFNLYDWYKDSLDAMIARGEIPADSKVSKVRITGIRLYSSISGTDATFNYLAIGGKDSTDASLRAQASVVNSKGETINDFVSDVNFGQIVNVSLDQLENSADAHNPQKTFVGWSFTGRNAASVVWWNPKAKNDKEYTSSNTDGAWSRSEVSGFVKNRRNISYQLTNYTKLIYPVFADTSDVKLNVKLNGSGSVKVKVLPTVQHEANVINPTVDQTISAAKTYTAKFGDYVLLSSTASNFVGWYGDNGQLLSDTPDYTASLYGDATITAKFASNTTADLEPYKSTHSHSIIWLQRADANAGLAGKNDGFYLKPVSNGNILNPSNAHEGEEPQKYEFYSNIDDVSGSDEIACYWSIANGQLLEAVAKDGYHWEMLLQDGTTVCLGTSSNKYRFVSAFDMKLICVPNTNSCSAKTGIIVNEYAVDFDRTTDVHNAKINGQVFTSDNEVIVDCGFVMAARPTGVSAPSFGSHESTKYSAQAWNSTTGQFTVSVDYTPGKAYYIRGYAIVMDIETNTYTLRYSDYVSISF